MPAFSRVELSGSTDGQPIAMGTTSTVIHDATSAANEVDEYHLWATNVDATDKVLTLEIGGTTFPNALAINVPANSTLKVVDGLQLGNGTNVDGKAVALGDIAIHGYVLRINQA